MVWPFSRADRAPAPAAPSAEAPPTTDQPWRHSAVPIVRRSFRAARPDRLAGGFGVFQATPRADLSREIRGLIGHARHAAHNFDLARSYEMLVRRHVIGPAGIRLVSIAQDAPDRPDRLARQLIEDEWEAWGQFGRPTLCGRLSWWGVECQVATSIAREGGCLLRFWRGRQYGRHGFMVEPIALDQLDLDLTGGLHHGGWIENGIEFSPEGRVAAYHLWDVNPGDMQRRVNRQRVRVPASDMIQVLVPEEIGQALGIPRTATALRLMNLGERFQESAMTAANYGAANMVFFTQADTGGQLSGGADAEVPIDDMEGGTMAMLPPGVTPVPHSPHYPEAAIEPFMRHMHTTIAAGVGVAAETLTADLSRANFSSLRAGKGEERDEWRMLQRAVYEALHTRVFAAWLPCAMLSGAVALPMAKLDKFSAVRWRPRGWASVNPRDDATANETNYRLGLRSLTEIAAETGRDFEEVCAERAAEREVMARYGLPLDASGGGGLAGSLNDYGVGVRSGAITPQVSDEAAFRGALGLPEMSPDALRLWAEQGSIRQPITLQKPGTEEPPASPSPAPAAPADPPNNESEQPEKETQ